MATTVTLTKVRTAASGTLYVDFAEGTQLEFENLQAMRDAATTAELDPNLLMLYLIGWWLKRNPDADNVQLLEGLHATFDLASATPFKVT